MSPTKPATFANLLFNDVRSENGTKVAKLLDLRKPEDSDLLKHFKLEAVPPGRVPAWVNVYKTKFSEGLAPWADVATGHTRALLALGSHPPDYEEATSGQYDALNALYRWIMASQGETGWLLPALYGLCRDLKDQAAKADAVRRRQGQKAIKLEEASRLLQKCFSVCLNDRTGDGNMSRKMGTYGLASLLFKTYFQLKSTALSKNIIKGIGAADLVTLDKYPKSHQVAYLYYLGVFAFLREDYVDAENKFVDALKSCHHKAKRNIELILDYLVPIRLARGVFPSNRLFREQSRIAAVYKPFVEACRTGDVYRYDLQLEVAEKRLTQRQTYPIMEKAREVAVRRLLKSAWIIAGKPPLMSIEGFRATFVAGSRHVLDSEEAECLVANMIAKGFIKGYISHEHQKVVLSKLLPFPWFKPIGPLTPAQQHSRSAAEKQARDKLPPRNGTES